MSVTARDRALCCECGTLRTVGVDYMGPGPHHRGTGWTGVTNLKCATCRAITRHAKLHDSNETDFTELDIREVDRLRRANRRRVAGLIAEGVEIVWRNNPMRSRSDDEPRTASIRLRWNGQMECVRVVLWEGATPQTLDCALDVLEEVLDDIDQPIFPRLRDAGSGLVFGSVVVRGTYRAKGYASIGRNVLKPAPTANCRGGQRPSRGDRRHRR